MPGGQGSAQPRRSRAPFWASVIRGSASRLTNCRRLLIGKRVGANLGDQSRPTAGRQPKRIRESSFRRGPSWSPRGLAGATVSPRRGAAGRFGPTGEHAASLRPEPLPPSGRRIAASRGATPRKDLLSAGSLDQRNFYRPGSEAGELAHSSRPIRSSRLCEDVRQARRRLRERGFSPDPGRWFRW